MLTSLNGFFKTTDSKGAFEEVAEAAKSIHTLADNLDTRTKELTANLNHFSSTGLHQYEASRSMAARPCRTSTWSSGPSRKTHSNSSSQESPLGRLEMYVKSMS